jgi:spermidine synthase
MNKAIAPRAGSLTSTAIALCLGAMLLALLAGPLAPTAGAAPRTVHTERSVYRDILVTEESGRRCLKFAVRREEHDQSCMYTADPQRLVFPYARMMFASLLVNPKPMRVLMVGLGGGSIPMVMQRLVPGTVVDVVEIDGAVVRLAERYFGFRQGPAMKVSVQDARVFVRRALQRRQQYDLILLDAFTGDYIPEHLMTKEFLLECRQLLSPNGVLAANTFAISELFHHESATYQAAFGELMSLRTRDSLNRIIVVSRAPLPQASVLRTRARTVAPAMARHGIEIEQFARDLTSAVNWRRDARVLTDQYSPANLLRQQGGG